MVVAVAVDSQESQELREIVSNLAARGESVALKPTQLEGLSAQFYVEVALLAVEFPRLCIWFYEFLRDRGDKKQRFSVYPFGAEGPIGPSLPIGFESDEEFIKRIAEEVVARLRADEDEETIDTKEGPKASQGTGESLSKRFVERLPTGLGGAWCGASAPKPLQTS